MECTAFRRLEHKTQVFTAGFHDHFRTRLTHSLEVAHVARTLARKLAVTSPVQMAPPDGSAPVFTGETPVPHQGEWLSHPTVNEDLAEAIALAHDLGHPPFGHAGEAALNECMAAIGGFNHNAQTLRVVEYLEHPYPAFRGLNLTEAVRAALATHETRYDRPATQKEGDEATKGRSDEGACLGESVEARIVRLADRLAYNLHDLEDAIGAGIIGEVDLDGVRIWNKGVAVAVRSHGIPTRPLYAIRRAVLDAILRYCLDQTVFIAQLSEQTPTTREERVISFRSEGPSPWIGLPREARQWLAELETFLEERVYRHPTTREADARGQATVRRLFEAYRANPQLLPDRFAVRVDEQGLDRVICDYIAGMTDRFCERECERVTPA